jgi:signal peptidase
MTERLAGTGRRARQALTVIGVLVLIALICVSMLYAFPQLIGADRSYVVLSGSMQPAIDPGDVILVGGVAPAAVQVGDVVTYDRGEAYPTTHRVVGIERAADGPRFQTKGDANTDADPQLVTGAQLVGRVPTVGGYLVVLPLFGHVVQFANTNTGLVLLVFVPLSLLILNEVYTRLGSTPVNESNDRSETERGEEPDTPVVSGATTAPAALDSLDLTLTLLVLVVVVPYSGFMTLETREPLSAMVFAGALVGLLLLGYVRARIWFAARRLRQDPDQVPSTDGGERVDLADRSDSEVETE